MLSDLKTLLSPKKPWLDLVYLGFFFLEWLVAPPGRAELWLSLAAMTLFIAAYVLVMRRRDWTVLVACALGLALGFALAPMNLGAAVFIVFAAPMIARLPDPALRTPALIILGPVVVLTGLILNMPWYFMLAAVGLGAVSALSAGTAARRAEQEALEALRLLDAGQEAARSERARMARDLHDLLGHTLSVIALKADLAERFLAADPDRAAQEVSAIRSISRDALAEVREVVTGLRPRDLSVAQAEITQRLEAAGLDVVADGAIPRLDREQAGALAMVLREAATNILRHAHASRVTVCWRDAAGRTELEITDDGAGSGLEPGAGLTGLTERLALLGGRLEIEDADGVTLRAILPEREARS